MSSFRGFFDSARKYGEFQLRDRRTVEVLGEYTPMDLSIRDTMGQSPSKHSDYTVLLKTLLHSSGVKVKEENLQELFQAIHKHCYWLDPEKREFAS